MLGWLKCGLRAVRRRPALAAAIVVPLTLATAVSSSLFAIADGLLFRAPPLKGFDQTVTVSLPGAGSRLSELAAVFTTPSRAQQFVQEFESSPLFSATVSAAIGAGGFNVRSIRQAGLHVAGVGINFFDSFGLVTRLGRTFTREDMAVAEAIAQTGSGALPVIISDGFWRREFGEGPDVVGRRVRIADRDVVVVGIMAPGVKFPGQTDVWAPRSQGPANRIRGYVQLSAGRTIDQVREAFPLLDFNTLRGSLRPPGAMGIVFIFGTTLVLLLLAWVQIGGLMLAGASDRGAEVAVRISLGASPRQVALEFAAEAFWLAGTACGLAYAMVPVITANLVALLPEQLTAEQYLQPGWRPFAFALLVTGLGILVVSVASVQVAGLSATRLFAQRPNSDAMHLFHMRRRLLIVQAACTALMLDLSVLAGLSYLNVARFDYGFDAEHVVIIDPALRLPPELRGDARDRYFNAHWQRIMNLEQRLNLLDEVQVAAAVSDTPIARAYTESWITLTGVEGQSNEPIRARNITGSSRILGALGATLLGGASFEDLDHRGRTDVAIVNQTLARQLSRIASVLGSRITTPAGSFTIIGIVRDLVDSTPDVPAEPLMLHPPRYAFGGNLLVVRTKDDAAATMPLLRQTVEAEFGTTRMSELRLMVDDVDPLVDPWRGRASIIGVVAAMGLPISIVGLASGMMFFVRRRAREIGIRLALGALPSQARALVIAFACRVVGIGSVIGVGLGALIGHYMSSLLFGVSSVGPVAIMIVVLVIAVCAGIGVYLPARHASRVAPAAALRVP